MSDSTSKTPGGTLNRKGEDPEVKEKNKKIQGKERKKKRLFFPRSAHRGGASGKGVPPVYLRENRFVQFQGPKGGRGANSKGKVGEKWLRADVRGRGPGEADRKKVLIPKER